MNKQKGAIAQYTSGEHSIDCKDKNTPDEPEVVVDVSSPPDTVKHVHELLEYAKGNHIESDIFKEESYVTIDIWDFAGQHLYYASHPIFLSPRALYILVHNLSKPLNVLAEPCVRQGTCDKKLENLNNETNLENLLSWLATVHSVAQVNDETDDNVQNKLPYLRPPVFIVGTHADKPIGDIAGITKEIQERISGKEYEKHVIRPLYCIDNTRSQRDDSVVRNRSRIKRIKKFFKKSEPQQRGKHKTGKVVDYMMYPSPCKINIKAYYSSFKITITSSFVVSFTCSICVDLNILL